MSVASVVLTTDCGVEWRLSYRDYSTYIASVPSGSFSICSASIAHEFLAGRKSFTLYFTNAFITFPSSEFKKLKDFLQQIEAAKAAA